MAWGRYKEYVPVAQRRAQALKRMEKLRKGGKKIEPIEIEGRTIAKSFWGKSWCEHLESYSDFSNRLPRGRRYARNGSVCHLAILPGKIEAIVSGSSLYHLDINIEKLDSKSWENIKNKCAGQVGTMLELLGGKISDQVMSVVTDRSEGLFPSPKEIQLDCSCPDMAIMCKHIAAALYGIGHRLDSQPELLFTLRGVDPGELIASEIEIPESSEHADNTIDDNQLSDIFGIELDDEPAAQMQNTKPAAQKQTKSKPSQQVKKSAKSKTVKTSKKSTSSKLSKNKPRQIVTKTKSKPRLRPTGKSVARMRSKSGLTVKQFANNLGVSKATISRWEKTSGRLRLTPASLQALEKEHAKLKQRDR